VTSASQVLVSAASLTKVFSDRRRGQIRAVDDVTFEAHAGEIFGLLGINGAGKTTTLRLLATMLEPTAGEASVCGHSISEEPQAVRHRIGFMSTATSLYGRLSAQEMITYFGRLNGMSRGAIEQRSRELFDLFAMNEFKDRRQALVGNEAEGVHRPDGPARSRGDDLR
jgi:sodium transport system ATP-binding protein